MLPAKEPNDLHDLLETGSDPAARVSKELVQ